MTHSHSPNKNRSILVAHETPERTESQASLENLPYYAFQTSSKKLFRNLRSEQELLYQQSAQKKKQFITMQTSLDDQKGSNKKQKDALQHRPSSSIKFGKASGKHGSGKKRSNRSSLTRPKSSKKKSTNGSSNKKNRDEHYYYSTVGNRIEPENMLVASKSHDDFSAMPAGLVDTGLTTKGGKGPIATAGASGAAGSAGITQKKQPASNLFAVKNTTSLNAPCQAKQSLQKSEKEQNSARQRHLEQQQLQYADEREDFVQNYNLNLYGTASGIETTQLQQSRQVAALPLINSNGYSVPVPVPDRSHEEDKDLSFQQGGDRGGLEVREQQPSSPIQNTHQNRLEIERPNTDLENFYDKRRLSPAKQQPVAVKKTRVILQKYRNDNLQQSTSGQMVQREFHYNSKENPPSLGLNTGAQSRETTQYGSLLRPQGNLVKGNVLTQSQRESLVPSNYQMRPLTGCQLSGFSDSQKMDEDMQYSSMISKRLSLSGEKIQIQPKDKKNGDAPNETTHKQDNFKNVGTDATLFLVKQKSSDSLDPVNGVDSIQTYGPRLYANFKPTKPPQNPSTLMELLKRSMKGASDRRLSQQSSGRGGAVTPLSNNYSPSKHGVGGFTVKNTLTPCVSSPIRIMTADNRMVAQGVSTVVKSPVRLIKGNNQTQVRSIDRRNLTHQQLWPAQIQTPSYRQDSQLQHYSNSFVNPSAYLVGVQHQPDQPRVRTAMQAISPKEVLKGSALKGKSVRLNNQGPRNTIERQIEELTTSGGGLISSQRQPKNFQLNGQEIQTKYKLVPKAELTITPTNQKSGSKKLEAKDIMQAFQRQSTLLVSGSSCQQQQSDLQTRNVNIQPQGAQTHQASNLNLSEFSQVCNPNQMIFSPNQRRRITELVKPKNEQQTSNHVIDISQMVQAPSLHMMQLNLPQTSTSAERMTQMSMLHSLKSGYDTNAQKLGHKSSSKLAGSNPRNQKALAVTKSYSFIQQQPVQTQPYQSLTKSQTSQNWGQQLQHFGKQEKLGQIKNLPLQTLLDDNARIEQVHVQKQQPLPSAHSHRRLVKAQGYQSNLPAANTSVISFFGDHQASQQMHSKDQEIHQFMIPRSKTSTALNFQPSTFYGQGPQETGSNQMLATHSSLEGPMAMRTSSIKLKNSMIGHVKIKHNEARAASHQQDHMQLNQDIFPQQNLFSTDITRQHSMEELVEVPATENKKTQQQVSQKAFNAQRNNKKSRLKITQAHQAQKELRRSLLLSGQAPKDQDAQNQVEMAKMPQTTKATRQNSTLVLGLQSSQPLLGQSNSTKQLGLKKQFAQMLLHQEYKQHVQSQLESRVHHERPSTKVKKQTSYKRKQQSHLFSNSNLQQAISQSYPESSETGV